MGTTRQKEHQGETDRPHQYIYNSALNDRNVVGRLIT